MKLGQVEQQANHLLGRRDAFHVACVLCTYSEDYKGIPSAGQRVRFTGDAFSEVRPARESEAAHGIIDPFLTERITDYQMFWVLLMPGLASAPRHDFDLTIILGEEMTRGQWDCRDCPD